MWRASSASCWKRSAFSSPRADALPSVGSARLLRARVAQRRPPRSRLVLGPPTDRRRSHSRDQSGSQSCRRHRCPDRRCSRGSQSRACNLRQPKWRWPCRSCHSLTTAASPGPSRRCPNRQRCRCPLESRSRGSSRLRLRRQYPPERRRRRPGSEERSSRLRLRRPYPPFRPPPRAAAGSRASRRPCWCPPESRSCPQWRLPCRPPPNLSPPVPVN